MTRDYTKIAIAIVLFAFLVFVVVQIFKFSGRRREAREVYDAAKAEHDQALADQVRLEDDFRYFSDPVNLSKELRSRFNYTLPGEKLLILVEKSEAGE